MSTVLGEIQSQPDVWEHVARHAATTTLLPRGARSAIIGCGTSFHVALSLAVLRELAGDGETDAFPASEAPLDRGYDAVLAISRSAETSEVAAALRRAPRSTSTRAITARPAGPVVDAADAVIVLDQADEDAIVQTRFPTSILLLARSLWGPDPQPAYRDIHAALQLPMPDAAVTSQHHVLLGTGWTIGLALEGALKLREAAQLHCEAYPALEYRHGPIACADAGTVVWLLGAIDQALTSDIARTGATVLAPELDPLTQLVVVQRAAVAAAELRGLDPDRPRALSRAVVLPTA